MQCIDDDHADFTLLVTQNGMGRDIWNVSFDNITMMLKVGQSQLNRH